MNLVDSVALLIFIGVFAAAFFAGFGRIIAAFLALAAGILAACAAYGELGGQLANLLAPINPLTADLIAFILLVAVISIVVFVVLLRSFAVSRLRTRLTFDMRGGLVSNLLVVIAAGVMAACVVVVVVQISDRTLMDLPAGSTVVTLRHKYNQSLIVSQALRMSPFVYDTIGQILPGKAPKILLPVPR